MKTVSYALVAIRLTNAQIRTHLDLAFIIGMLDKYEYNLGDQWKARKKPL